MKADVQGPRASSTPARHARWPRWALLWVLSLALLWGWMTWDAYELRRRLDRVETSHTLFEAKSAALDAHVALTQANFGRAATDLDAAVAIAERARARYERDGAREVVAIVARAQSELAIAKTLAAKLDTSARDVVVAAAAHLDDARRVSASGTDPQ